VRADAGQRRILEIEASDLVGNTRKAEWELRLP
jgi:hypothetical protein